MKTLQSIPAKNALTNFISIALAMFGCLLPSANAHAEAALADLIFLLPQIFIIGVYLQIKQFFWLMAALLAISWLLYAMISYSRDHDGGSRDPLLNSLAQLSLHRFMTGVSIVAVLWLGLTHMMFKQETLDSLTAADTALQKTRQQKNQQPEPLPVQEPPGLVNPFGGAWPDRMGYLAGAPLGASNGKTSIVISNSLAPSAVYVKLCYYGEVACKGIRHAYIGARWQFRMENVTPGEYELRYRETKPNGVAAKSRQITIVGNSAADEITWQIPYRPPNIAPPDTPFLAMDPAVF
jgi:hypothetical protein